MLARRALCGLLFLFAAQAMAGELKPWAGGAAAPFALKDLSGRVHRLEDYKGKVVVLNFWATWCEPCREEMPSLQRLADKFAGRAFAVLAVDMGEGEPRVRAFLEKMPVRFTVLLDRDSAGSRTWKVRVLPTTLVIDPEQRVRYLVQGDLEWDAPEVVSTIEKLLPVK
jgi:thiol-disulfide isomerase/thioredoxin